MLNMLKAFAVATALAAVPAVAAAEASIGVGKWVWNAKESHYSEGAYAKEQTMEIKRLDKDGIAVSQNVTLVDGKNFTWSIDAPFDDQMRHGSQWMSFAFSRISDTQFHDRYIMDADGKTGEETFTIKGRKLILEGASLRDGKKMPYVEVWDRVD